MIDGFMFLAGAFLLVLYFMWVDHRESKDIKKSLESDEDSVIADKINKFVEEHNGKVVGRGTVTSDRAKPKKVNAIKDGLVEITPNGGLRLTTKGNKSLLESDNYKNICDAAKKLNLKDHE